MSDFQPKYCLPPSCILITLAICLLLLVGYLLAPIQVQGIFFSPLAPHNLITALVFLLLTIVLARTGRRETWPALMMCAVVFQDSLQPVSPTSFTVALRQAAPVLGIIVVAILQFHPRFFASRLRRAMLLGPALCVLLTIIWVTLVPLVSPGGSGVSAARQADPGTPVPLVLVNLILLVVAGSWFGRQIRQPRARLFGLMILISFAPLATAQLVPILGLQLGKNSVAETAASLRWLAYLVALAGLGLDYLHVHITRLMHGERTFLHRVLDAIPHQITVSDDTGRFTLVNSTAATFYGKEVQEVEGRRLCRIHPDQNKCEEFLTIDRFVLEAGGSHTTEEVAVKNGVGEERWLKTIRTLLPASDGMDAQVLNFTLDITQQKETDRSLHRVQEILAYRWETERIIATISAIFMNRPIGDVDTGIDEALGILGRFVQADRCYVFQLDADHDLVINSHEWCGESIPPLDSQYRSLPNTSLPWVHAKLQNNEVVNVPQVDDLPPEAAAERERWRCQNLRSLLLAPINSEGKRLGSVGFESLHTQRDWLPEEIALLRAVADMFLNAWTRQRAELELRGANQRLQDIIDFLPDATFVIDRDKKVMAWNRAMEKMSGVAKDEVLGRGDHIYALPFYGERRAMLIDLVGEDNPDLLKGYDFVERVDRQLRAETHLPCVCSGKGAHVWTTATDLRDEQGKVIGAIESIRDITERKHAELALRKSEQQHRLLIETMNDGLGIVDPHGLITHFNKAFLRMLGYEHGEVLGRHLTEFVDEDGREILRRQHAKRRQGERDAYLMTFVRKDGTPLPTIVSPAPILGDGGEYQGSFAIVVDITEIERTKQELRQARDAAEASNRAKSEFLANMSHEIRTPMNCIIGLTDLLREMNPSPEQKYYLDMVDNSGRALLSLINDILDLSKIEAGQMDLELIETDTLALMEEAAWLMATHAENRGLDLICRFDPRAPRRVICDPIRLRQVLINLLNNAIKFTKEGHILLDISLEGRWHELVDLRIAITDTGIGIPSDKVQHVFEKFTQADASTTRKFGGTGLGLAICQQLVHKMGGEIGVASEVGHGSTFWLKLTLTCLPGPTPGPRPDSPHAGERALVVTGNQTAARVWQEQLDSHGLRSDRATDEHDALASLAAAGIESDPYRIVLLDEKQVGFRASNLARTIRRQDSQRNPALIALRTLSDTEESQLLASRCDATLFKPVQLDKLTRCLQSLEPDAGDSATLPGPAEVPPEQVKQDRGQEPAETSDLQFDALVLLAEDNPLNQKVATLMLEKLGCRVETAINGAEAVMMIRKTAYDLVLMDCQMPEMDGYEATRAIRALPVGRNRVPIVAMTAHSMTGDREQCLAAGMDDYAAKPITKQTLREKLRKWCDHRSVCVVK